MNAIDEATVQKFIQLRAQGRTFDTLAKELQVSRKTLVKWSHRFQHEIQNLRAVELENQADQFLVRREARWEALGRDLRRAEAELAQRDFTKIPTDRLLSLVLTLRRQVAQETNHLNDLRFTASVHELSPEDLLLHEPGSHLNWPV